MKTVNDEKFEILSSKANPIDFVSEIEKFWTDVEPSCPKCGGQLVKDTEEEYKLNFIACEQFYEGKCTYITDADK